MWRFPPGIRKSSPQIFCDICGTDCRKEMDNESAALTAIWGWDSKKDGDKYHIDLCESCFDKTIAFLKSIRTINPVEKCNLDALEARIYLPEEYQ
jgi:hypothetical protein